MLETMQRAGIILAMFAVLGVGMVALSNELTREKIADNQRTMLLSGLHKIISPEQHDNELFSDVIWVTDEALLGTDEPVAIYRARKRFEPVAAVMNTVAPDGYNGSIHLLVGVYTDGTLAGVRVLSHKETPGLGDGIEERKSDWILAFTGRSLTDPEDELWQVKRDGGYFDQMTGATITPRAIVHAVNKALHYFDMHNVDIFSRPSEPEGGTR